MQNPKKPVHPHKVELPTATIMLTQSHDLYKNHTIADIIKMLPENYPLDKALIKVEDMTDPYYGDNGDRTYLEYEVEEPNTHLHGQMKAYHRKVKSYAKKMVKYEAAMEVYRKEKTIYDKWFKAEEHKRRIEDAKARMARAQKDLQKLKIIQ